MILITSLLSELLPYLLGAVALLGGVWGYGRKRESDGRNKVVDAIEEADRNEAGEIRKKLDAAAGDGDAIERLRQHGKLWDSDAG